MRASFHEFASPRVDEPEHSPTLRKDLQSCDLAIGESTLDDESALGTQLEPAGPSGTNRREETDRAAVGGRTVTALSQRYPIVSVIHEYPGLGIDTIGTNDRQGTRLIVGHLLERKPAAIGFFGYCQGMSWACCRSGAYYEAMTEGGLPVHRNNVIDIPLEPP